MTKPLFIFIIIGFLFNCKHNNNEQTEPNDEIVLAVNTEGQSEKTKEPTKNAEIVFCLDATGSMSGLIGTAKEKIWDIVSELAQSKDIDTLKMGMVFYRDRGDTFTTRQIDLTTDLDEVYSDLLEMTANGGGDTPESVNQALYESITKMAWSEAKTTYKTIFVVGDCPPHMDYRDDVKYTESCKIAFDKDIIINTIKLGNSCDEAIYHFKNMSTCTNGNFLMLDQNAKDYVIATPYDSEINDTSKEIDESRMYYGTRQEREYNYEKKSKSLEVYDKGSTTANSARAEYKNSFVGKKGSFGTNEIISDYNEGKLKLDTLSDDQLPKILKNKSIQEKEAIIKDIAYKRRANSDKLIELIKKKKAYIDSKVEEQKDTTSFSKEVVKIMSKQSKAD